MAMKGENIYKSKDGRWEGRYRTNNAERKYHSVYGRSYTEVREKLIKLKATLVTYNPSSRRCIPIPAFTIVDPDVEKYKFLINKF